MRLAVTAQVPYILVHFVDAGFELAAYHHQQRCRDEQSDQPDPFAAEQIAGSLPQVAPGHGFNLFHQFFWQFAKPFKAQGLVAGHPEGLFGNGVVQAAGNFAQLFMAELGTSEDGQLAAQFLVQLVVNGQALFAEDGKGLLQCRAQGFVRLGL